MGSETTKAVLTTSGMRFMLDGRPFPFTGFSFFNAIYNEPFNASESARRDWLRRFGTYGMNVVRLWCQWDSKRTFVDSGPEQTMYEPDGGLRPGPLARLKDIAATAADLDMVIEVAMFSQESWHDDIRLGPEAADRAVAGLTRELMPFRNVALQIWNEFSERALDHLATVKSIDPNRLVTNSSGGAGVLLAAPQRGELERKLDYLSPHTSRQDRGDGPHWLVAPREIEYLLARFRKPVVDDEPARNGTPMYGGPKNPTNPYDHILQIHAVWKARGHIVYHHDLFQVAGSSAVPPSGIPEPEFNPYHRKVFEFIALRERYFDLYKEDGVSVA